MRVLIINTSERIGGAAIAASRLMNALKNNGVNAKMLVRDKQTDRLTVVQAGGRWLMPLRFVWERACIYLNNYMSRANLFQIDIANVGMDVTQMPEFKEADVIHLHWTNQGFLSLDDIDKILHSGKRVVVTMHDQWYFTGVCHYSDACDNYKQQCHHCHLLNHGGILDKAKSVYESKQKMYADADITFVGCSRWMADMARQSRLTRGHKVVNIPNAIDTEVFKPSYDKMEARITFGLPHDKHLLLFGAQRITDERKGYKFLTEACEIIQREHPEMASQIGIVVVGGDSNKVADQIHLPVYTVPYLSDEAKMVMLYNAVDLYVTPSLQDNLPNTIVEATACGTPCVGFRVGGIPEMIDHKQNGYVAGYKDAKDFANGILWSLSDDVYQQLCDNARATAVERYSESSVANKHLEVYN